MICPICGKTLVNIVSKDHVYPRAIWKWQQETLGQEEFYSLKTAIESSKNIVKVHPECNYEKEESLMDIEELTLSEKQRARLDAVGEVVNPFLDGYTRIKEQLVEKQAGRCFICKKVLGQNRVLRRIDAKKPRTINNGCIVCHSCNRDTTHIISTEKH